jgi:hypothetical protein
MPPETSPDQALSEQGRAPGVGAGEVAADVRADEVDRTRTDAPGEHGTITPETPTAVDPDPGPDTSASASASGGRWIPWTALAVYLGCRVLTIAFVATANLFTHHSILHDLDIWDGRWFLRAVHHGYPTHLPMIHGHVAANPIAFFPFFPMVVRAIDVTGLSPVVASLLVSVVTGATAVLGVGLVARRLAGDAAGNRAALLFAVFPGTFVFSLGYSEGIVITCVSFGFLALLDHRWWLAGLLGMVATASSPVALAFVVSCAWCAGRSIVKDRRFGALVAPLLAPLGFIAYMGYLWIHTGTLTAWRLTERGGWKSYPSAVYPFRIIWQFVSNPLSPTITGQILFFGTVAAVIGVVLMVREHQPAPVFLYGICALGAAAVSAPVGLRPRFLMLAFPAIIALGTRYEGRTHRWLVAVSVLGLVFFSVLEIANTPVFP